MFVGLLDLGASRCLLFSRQLSRRFVALVADVEDLRVQLLRSRVDEEERGAICVHERLSKTNN